MPKRDIKKLLVVLSMVILTFTACSKKSRVTGVNDTTAPVISNVAKSPTASGATITWTTDEVATSQVEYGFSTSYGSSTTETTTLTTSHSVNITELIASTVYHYRVKSKDASNNQAISNDDTFTTTADTTGPVISNVSVPLATLKNTSAVITWTTDEAATTKIEYGLTASYGSSSEKDTTTLVTSHSITITGLTKNTTYHYRVSSRDSSNNVTTDQDRTFTTTNTAPLVLYDFEDGTVKGWINANDPTNFPAVNLGTPTNSTTFAHGGTNSLAFPFDMTKRDTRYDAPLYIVNDAAYVRPSGVGTDLSNYGTLTIYMYLPTAPAPTKPIQVSVYVKTGNWIWYESNALQAITPGTWATITLDFGNAKKNDAETGLTIANLNDVKEIGIHIGDGRGDATTTLYIDDVIAE